MKLGIMQPYFFPYIGYFQLIYAVDKFVFYDDVNFITRGWISRNRILTNEKEKLITIPCAKASQNKLIKNVKVDLDEKSKTKIIKTIYHSYNKAPFFEPGFHLVEQILNAKIRHIGELATKSIIDVCNYLNIQREMITSSTIFNNSHLKKADRLIDICKNTDCEDYVNPIGGTEIYKKEYFKANGINLHFLKPKYFEYKQFENIFVPWLSIIDVIMFNSNLTIQEFLSQYELI